MVSLSLTITAVLSIILGLLILFVPKILRMALGLYFLIVGILGIIQI